MERCLWSAKSSLWWSFGDSNAVDWPRTGCYTIDCSVHGFQICVLRLIFEGRWSLIGDAVRSQTSNGVWDAVGRSHEHPPPDQRERAEGTTPTGCSALFCCSFRGYWLHLCASFPNEACFCWKLILLRSKKFTPLSVGFFIVWSVWRLRRCLSLEGSSTSLGSKMWSVTTKGLLRQTLWLFLRH